MIGQGNAGDPGSIVSDVLNNATLDFNRVEDLTYNGAISGSGLVIKEAAGKLTLTGSNSYGGGTNVNAGTLIAANTIGSATGSGPVSVAGGATVGGSGTMAGAVTLADSAHLSPGQSIGTLTVGSLQLSAGSILDYDLDSPASGDLTIITTAGGLELDGGIVNITPGAGFSAGQYTLLDYATSFSGSPANLSIGSAPAGFVYEFVNNPGATSIDVVVSVPEPTALLSALALLPLLCPRRRARQA
jgi:fibronectin-binding autotransporter adhesin